MSEDLKAYLHDELEHHLSELYGCLQDEDGNKQIYHLEQAQAIAAKLRG